MVAALTLRPNRIDGAPEREWCHAAVRIPLRCVAVVTVLLAVCCWAFTIEKLLSAPERG